MEANHNIEIETIKSDAKIKYEPMLSKVKNFCLKQRDPDFGTQGHYWYALKYGFMYCSITKVSSEHFNSLIQFIFCIIGQ